MTETRRLKNVVIFIQTILSFVLSRKAGIVFESCNIILCSGANLSKFLIII